MEALLVLKCRVPASRISVLPLLLPLVPVCAGTPARCLLGFKSQPRLPGRSATFAALCSPLPAAGHACLPKAERDLSSAWALASQPRSTGSTALHRVPKYWSHCDGSRPEISALQEGTSLAMFFFFPNQPGEPMNSPHCPKRWLLQQQAAANPISPFPFKGTRTLEPCQTQVTGPCKSWSTGRPGMACFLLITCSYKSESTNSARLNNIFSHDLLKLNGMQPCSFAMLFHRGPSQTGWRKLTLR